MLSDIYQSVFLGLFRAKKYTSIFVSFFNRKYDMNSYYYSNLGLKGFLLEIKHLHLSLKLKILVPNNNNITTYLLYALYI